MPAYHSKFTGKCASTQRQIGNMALLPLRTKFRGPALQLPTASDSNNHERDIIDEAIYYFKSNVFFTHYAVRSPADRVLIYITLFILEALRKLHQCPTRGQAANELKVLGLVKFDLPGEAGFPRELNALYAKPANHDEEAIMRAYLQQIRQETAHRLLDKVWPIDGAGPNKWWMCFAKRKFINQSLSKPGYMD